MGLRGRLERLEGRIGAPLPVGSAAGVRMREHLQRLAGVRRGEFGPDEAAEIRSADEAIRERMAARRGEGW